MSNKKVQNARVKKYSGPFPDHVDRLQRLYALPSHRLQQMLFDDVADKLHGGRVSLYPLTTDLRCSHQNSVWLAYVRFERHKHIYRVYFPKATDQERVDGTSSSRHIAVYVKGDELPATFARDISEFVQTLIDSYVFLYQDAIEQNGEVV